MEYLVILLEEYKSVRAESLEALNQIHTIVQYGLASVGVTVGAVFVTSRHDVTAAVVIVMVIVPTLIAFTIIMMAFAVHRVVQARQYLRALEVCIVREFLSRQTPSPSWERARKAAPPVIRPYRGAIAATVAAVLVLGPGLGGFMLASHHLWLGFIVAEPLDLLSVVGVGWACVVMYRKIAKMDEFTPSSDEMLLSLGFDHELASATVVPGRM